MPITVTSTVKINQAVLDRLSEAAVQALIKTGDAVLTQVKNAEVMPFDTGTLQNDSTFLDTSQADSGLVRIVSSTPYARRLYYNPESVQVREHTVREYTIKKGKRAGTVVKEHKRKGYVAGKVWFRTTSNHWAQDHWFRFWLPDGSRRDYIPKVFARFCKGLMKS